MPSSLAHLPYQWSETAPVRCVPVRRPCWTDGSSILQQWRVDADFHMAVYALNGVNPCHNLRACHSVIWKTCPRSADLSRVCAESVQGRQPVPITYTVKHAMAHQLPWPTCISLCLPRQHYLGWSLWSSRVADSPLRGSGRDRSMTAKHIGHSSLAATRAKLAIEP